MAKWKHKISIKEHFSEDESDEQVKKVCSALVPQLKWILATERKNKKLDSWFLDELDNCSQEFEFIIKCIDDGSDASEYGWENWCEAFNNWMEELYNISDTVTAPRNFFDTEKFLWVG
jgi:hypothetical protein